MTGDGRKEADMLRTMGRRLRSSWSDLAADEVGDVPGWVLVTLVMGV